jgi:hypothetical protein
MILPIGTYKDEQTGEVKNRVLIFGRTIKDAEFKTVGQRGTSMLKMSMSPGRGENLVNVKMWGYDAVDYADTKKGTTFLLDAFEDAREYNGKTYIDYIPLNVLAMGERETRSARGRRAAKVEPQEPATDDGFTDIVNKDDLPWEQGGEW